MVAATREGLAQGVALPGDITMFRGLPFAAPPLQQLRWRAPQTAPARVQPLLAQNFAAACPQRATSEGVFAAVQLTFDADSFGFLGLGR